MDLNEEHTLWLNFERNKLRFLKGMKGLWERRTRKKIGDKNKG